MEFKRTWSMPSKNTFSIKPINELIEEIFLEKSLLKKCVAVDPFSGNSPFSEKCMTNDIDSDKKADSNIDALEFLRKIDTNSVDLLLFDPPYSPRQVSEHYKKAKQTVNMQTTQSSFWSKLKKEIARVTKKGGYVITCGWNSGGIGKSLNFRVKKILLVPHGGWHNDTIVTVEEKV